MVNFVNKCLLMREKFVRKCIEKIHCGKFEFFNCQQLLSKNLRIEGKMEIPKCKKSTFLQSLKGIVCWDRARTLHEFVDHQHRTLGPIFRMNIGAVSGVFVNSPEGYQRIFKLEGSTPENFVPEAWKLYSEMRKCPRGLLFMNGEEWLNNRRILNKLLLKPCTAKDIIIKSCENAAIKLCNEWKFYADEHKIIPELEKNLYLWSIEVIMSTLMGTTWNLHKNEISEDLNILGENLHKIFIYSAKLSLLPSKLAVKFQLPVWRKFVRVMDTTMSVTRKLVLQMEKISNDGLLDLMKNSGIRDDNLVRIVTDMIIAAGDTTTYSTQWALYLLSINEQVQDKILNICRSNTAEEIISNSYIRGVFRESLRLYPTAPFLVRTLPQDSIIEAHTIRKGELILMSLYSSGRDENNFPQANEFSPERWNRNNQNKYENVINPLGSLPFAAGARSCIGRKLSEAQMTLTIAQVIKNFKITCDNADNIKMILHLISVPSEPIKLRLTTRH